MKKIFLFLLMTPFLLISYHVYASGIHAGGHSGNGARHWQAPADMAKRINPVLKTPESVQRGRDLYLENCAVCHGQDARGDGPASGSMQTKPADLTVMAGNHPDGDFAWKISQGRGSMPGWQDRMSVEQVWDLVNFIQNLKNTTEKNDTAPRH